MPPITPKTFRGTRDFLPEVMVARSDLIDRIRGTFELYGFSPLETPAIEYMETLAGKYGDEGEKLLYKLAYKGGDVLALRYDLTIPLARVAAQNPNLPKPFKRYQIQPVWRADRPQIKQGRFREFYQCDVDIVGSDSLAADAEILAMTVETLTRLDIGPFTVRINHRELLAAIIRAAGIPDDALMTASRCLDKWDKIGAGGVRAEMENEGFDAAVIQRLLASVDEDPKESSLARMGKLESTVRKFGGSEGLEKMKEIFQLLEALGVDEKRIAFWPSLARGLDYYTGPIFETFHDDLPHMGSLTGGGRYDNLIGIFLGEQIPATGTTIGIDRILAALQQTNRLQMAPSKTQE
ncbi:MAG: histidine--tRNA ligase, partial [Candidatus Eisenbacteria bacterium]|nr:histidine--tRNA ligase [Candidatus Eisenbacteria bacterium]